MRTERIVQRQNLKEQLDNLKRQVSTSRPLVEAGKQLHKAYLAGYKQRLLEEVEENKTKKEATPEPGSPSVAPVLTEQAFEPSHDGEDTGSPQGNEQAPIG